MGALADKTTWNTAPGLRWAPLSVPARQKSTVPLPKTGAFLWMHLGLRWAHGRPFSALLGWGPLARRVPASQIYLWPSFEQAPRGRGLETHSPKCLYLPHDCQIWRPRPRGSDYHFSLLSRARPVADASRQVHLAATVHDHPT